MTAYRTFRDWLRRSQSPPVRWLRTAVKRNRVLMRILRVVIPVLLAELDARIAEWREWWRPVLSPKLRAILDARSMGGGLSLGDLDTLWTLGAKGLRISCLAEGAELKQMRLVLGRAGAAAVGETSPQSLTRALTQYDFITVAADMTQAARLNTKPGAESKFVWLAGGAGLRSPYLKPAPKLRGRSRSESLRSLLDGGGRPRVVMLNDIGLQFGAGIGQRRQAASFLLNGWDVGVMAWTPGRDLAEPAIVGASHFQTWHGVEKLGNFPTGKAPDPAWVVERVATKVAAFNPHAVIVGNIHGAGWPVGLLTRLQQTGALVVAYMHDVFFVTGRCAQPGPCVKFRTGCDATCPTPHEYPRLEPELIADAWRARGEVFTGAAAVPLIGNSRWTADIARQRFGDAARIEVVHLGLDEALFAPVDKRAARDLLGIPQDALVVTMGAVDIDNQWKGGPLFQTVYETLQSRPNVEMVLFGRSSERYIRAKSFGLVRDERLMPLLYGAADIFVSTGTAESFGQTLLEASACGVPVVAFNVGGVPDVIVHGETGLLVDSISAQELLTAVDRLIAEPELRSQLGQNGRKRVEQHFSLGRQGQAWVDCLKRLC